MTRSEIAVLALIMTWVPACGTDAPLGTSGAGGNGAVSAEAGPDEQVVIFLGRVPPNLSPPTADAPPADRPPSELTTKLQEMSVTEGALAAKDPTRFYTMRMDYPSGNVFAIGDSITAAQRRAQMMAPNNVAPSSFAAGTVPAAPGAMAGGPTLVSYDISDGIDNRVYVGATQYDSSPTASVSGKFFAAQVGWCSGTMFALNTVLTAAHCVVGQSSLPFSPRQRADNSDPFGTASPSSVVSVQWAGTFTQDNCLNTWTFPVCQSTDFAVVKYSSTAFTSTPNYAGFEWATDAYVATSGATTTGYPACADTGIPNCVEGGPYQDALCNNVSPVLLGAASTSNPWPYNDGSKPIMQTGCDTTFGQSGSAIFDRSNSAIYAITEFNDCDTNCVHSSIGPRINTTFANFLLTFR